MTVKKKLEYVVILYIVFTYIFLLVNSPAFSQQIRAVLQPGIHIVCHPSYKIFIECYSNSAKNLNQWLNSNLQNPTETSMYQKANSFIVPLNKFKYSLYTTAFTKLFRKDALTQDGWVHTVPTRYSLNRDALNLLSIALTGTAENAEKIIFHPLNKDKTLPLKENEKIIIPSQLLIQEIKLKITLSESKNNATLTPSEPNKNSLTLTQTESFSPIQNSLSPPQPYQIKINHPELKYGKDEKGEYLIYKIKRGETIHGTVIPLFTTCKTKKEKLIVSKEILKRSGFTSDKQVKANSSIKIPLKYIKPELVNGISSLDINTSLGKSARKDSLKNIVVILDPGHGGKDKGALREFKKVFEDELNYDIAVRTMKYLQERTSAKVYMTLRDNSEGFEPYNGKTFLDDEDEIIPVNPPYNPQEKDASAHLRWILANSIMRNNEATGITRNKMIFISIHFDSLPDSYSGARVFVPSSSYRTKIETPKSRKVNFSSFAEWRDNKPRILTASEKIRDEEYSRRFANMLVSNLKQNNIAIYNNGLPIQEIINRSPRSTFVPAVLRNTEIPTKILIECANLNNDKDLSNATNPAWRQKLAETIAKSITSYFKE